MKLYRTRTSAKVHHTVAFQQLPVLMPAQVFKGIVTLVAPMFTNDAPVDGTAHVADDVWSFHVCKIYSDYAYRGLQTRQRSINSSTSLFSSETSLGFLKKFLAPALKHNELYSEEPAVLNITVGIEGKRL